MPSIYPCHHNEFEQARSSIIHGISIECAIDASKGGGFLTRKNLHGNSSEYPPRKILKCSKVKRDFPCRNKPDLCSIAKDNMGDEVLIEKNPNVGNVSLEYNARRILKGFKVKRDCLFGNNDENVCSNVGSGPLEDLKIDNNYGAAWEAGYQKWCDKDIRSRIKATLELFRETLWKLQQENKNKPRVNAIVFYTTAANVLKRNKRWLNTNKWLGCIAGVEIDDEFQSKTELKIVGLHHQQFCGIDYLLRDGVTLATSVVVTRRYANEMHASNVLVYIGEGGNPRVRNICPLKDQNLERGNLALKNSIEHKTPVRVIRCKCSHGQKPYVYEGLYLVETYWQDRGEFGKLVFKFLLRKDSGQQKISKCITSVSERIFNGNERESSTRKKLAQDIKRSPYVGSENKSSSGCDCVGGCSKFEDCSCKVKNGGKMPYDYDECLVRKMPLIYECGPSCKCSLSCMNRVSQRGTRARLELLKNNFSTYGVRSKSHIPKGSFICKYLARNGFRGKEKQEESYDVAMDVSRYANVGRFINNSHSPNLYGQRVVGHEDEPQMMLFAMRNISPLEELTIGYKNQILNS